MRKLFTILLAVLLTSSVFAQSPEKMSYQAVIRNNSNVLVTNTQIGMEINIRQGSVSGTVVYSETQTPTTNANGLVSIEIGGSAGFNAIDWSAGPYFIETKTAVVPPLTTYTITGTSQLLSVPYALHAKTADAVTGTITISTPYKSNFNCDVNMLITYGQSLAVGGGATDSSSDMRKTLSFPGGCNEWQSEVDITDPVSVSSFYGTDFVELNSLVEKSHPPVAASAIAWMSLLEVENNVNLNDFDYQFVLSTPGESGAPIESFLKNTSYYRRVLFSVEKAMHHSILSGKTFNVPVLFWVQGEANITDTKAEYYAKLNQLFLDLNTDIKSITGQTKDVQFITYQTSPVVGTIPYPTPESPTTYSDSGPSFAQLQLAIDKENVHIGGAMYQFEYGDIWHPTDRAVIGHQAGIQAKRIINDEKPLVVFRPVKHFVQTDGANWLLNIEFDVPVLPMRFDVSGDLWHNKNGKQVNFGFSLLNSSLNNIILSEPEIRRGNTLIIKCSENPAGCKLSYALNGHYGGGNLCDSQNIIIHNKNIDYVVDNFCPAFRDYLIL